MVYYVNELYDSKSINELCNEFTLYVNDIIHEANMSMLKSKYSFICENGYEMPLNEAEEQKQGFFKKMIERIKQALKNLCDKAVIKLNIYMDNHPNSKVKPFIQKIHDIFQKASRKLDNASSTDEAKSISDDAKEEVKDVTKDGMKYDYFHKNDTFDKLIQNKELGTLRALLCGILGGDPTFVTTEYNEALQYIKEKSKELFGESFDLNESYEKQEDEYTKDQDEWNDEYYRLMLVWYRDNFAPERLKLIKKVGKEVYKNRYTWGKSCYDARHKGD